MKCKSHGASWAQRLRLDFEVGFTIETSFLDPLSIAVRHNSIVGIGIEPLSVKWIDQAVRAWIGDSNGPHLTEETVPSSLVDGVIGGRHTTKKHDTIFHLEYKSSWQGNGVHQIYETITGVENS